MKSINEKSCDTITKTKLFYRENCPPIPNWKQSIQRIVAALTVYRLKQKITQEELAFRINTSQSVIARFERLGRMPSIEFIHKVADGLGVKLQPLCMEKTNNEQASDDNDLPESNIPAWQQNLYYLVADLTVFRVKHRITQGELAKKMDTTQSVIARFERGGRVPSIEFIYKIANALGVELKPLQIVDGSSSRSMVI